MSKTGDTINILTVDDEDTNRLILRSFIEKNFSNVKVFEANSGLSALSVIMKTRMDIIILDIQMPQMDGFETAKIIQTRAKTQHIPIVFLTAVYKSEEFQKKGFDVGAVDYLTKPIEPEDLINKIRTYVRFIEQQRYHNLEEETVERQVEERIADLPDESLKKEIIERKQMKDISHEIYTSLKAILASNEVLKKMSTDFGYKECLSDIYKIEFESKQMLHLSKSCENT